MRNFVCPDDGANLNAPRAAWGLPTRALTLSRYRPDIDGLRAVAVAAVVLFHAGFGVGGGFVGVDVFFVISGYLITAHLLDDLAADRFSILTFYERRARRILPALFVMMAGTAAGAVLFLPHDLKLLAQTAAATALSLSNVYFFDHTGYFDLDAAATPFLHTWSLAVEEQFYLLFPMLLWALSRLNRGAWTRRRGIATGLLLVWAGSFVLSAVQTASAPRAAFYLPTSRAWELLTGSLAAFCITTGAPLPDWLRGRASRETAALLGVVLILAPMLLLTERSAFPGWNALCPCLGAALVILSGAGAQDAPTMAARLLGTRPFVALGLISYSLYLWHWPLLALSRYYAPEPPGPWMRAALVLAALALAIASWRWVEQPFRSRRILADRRGVFAAAGAAIAVALVASLAVTITRGAPQRLPPAAIALAAGEDDYNPYRDRCFAVTAADMAAGRSCRIGVRDSRPPSLIVWGDSHADALMAGFDAQARAHGVWGIDAAHRSCPPLLDVEVRETDRYDCPALNAAVLALIERLDIRTVVLVARWGGYAEGRRYFAPLPVITLSDERRGVADDQRLHGDRAVFTAALQRTVVRLRAEGRRVYLVGPIPEVDRPVAGALALAKALNRPAAFAPTRAAYAARQTFVLEALRRTAAKGEAVVIDPAQTLCAQDPCRLIADGRPLYYDADHLSRHGALFLAPTLEPVFTAR